MLNNSVAYGVSKAENCIVMTIKDRRMAKGLKKDCKKPEDSRSSNSRQIQPESLVEFLRQSPLVGLELDLKRDPDVGRDVDLGD